MKIGVITYNSAHNYDSVLQAWALQEKLIEYGHEVQIINYRKKSIDISYRLYAPHKPLDNTVANFVYGKFKHYQFYRANKNKVKKYNQFERFINERLRTTQVYTTYSELEEAQFDFDMVIAGSDQIWNGKLTKRIDQAYFLAFMGNNVKKVSYAASLGYDEIEEMEKQFFIRYLKDFDLISVREGSAQKTIQELTNKEVHLVLDPIMLHEKTVYDKIKKSPPVKTDYIYVHNEYPIKIDENLNQIAEEISKRLKLPIVHNRDDITFTNELKKFAGGPGEFIGCVANAKYVITNSFHCTSFSIIYERNFIAIPHFSTPQRMMDLLDALNLSNHLIKSVNHLPENLSVLEIQNALVHESVSKLRAGSFQFLERAFQGETDKKNKVEYEDYYFHSKDVYSCYGCTACESACPTGAIGMENDTEGFWYPVIDDDKCTHCNLCRRVCIYGKKELRNDEPEFPKVFGVKHKDKITQSFSQSGGLFTALYSEMLRRGGKVVGVRFTDDLEAIYDIAETEEECLPFRLSKYVAASHNVKSDVKKLLDSGVPMLFAGTPCQIAGLKSYLGKDYDQLVTAEMICRGVPSPKVFRMYKEYLEETYQSKIVNFEFRNKLKGWNKPYVCVEFESGEVMLEESKLNNLYRALEYNLRPTCYTCEFASLEQGVADIVMGDFWGVDNEHPDFFDNDGVSLLKINTQKGLDFFDKTKDEMFLQESTYEKGYRMNHNNYQCLRATRHLFMSQIDDVDDIDALLQDFNIFKRKKKIKK